MPSRWSQQQWYEHYLLVVVTCERLFHQSDAFVGHEKIGTEQKDNEVSLIDLPGHLLKTIFSRQYQPLGPQMEMTSQLEREEVPFPLYEPTCIFWCSETQNQSRMMCLHSIFAPPRYIIICLTFKYIVCFSKMQETVLIFGHCGFQRT